MPKGPAWTSKELEIVRTGWVTGRSAAMISRDLRGRSRSAVIALVNRMGIVRPGEVKEQTRGRAGAQARRLRQVPPPASREKRQTVFEPAPASPEPVKAPVAAPDSVPVAFDELGPRHCRYPVTAALPHKFCGAPKAGAGAYCAFHHPRTLSARQ